MWGRSPVCSAGKLRAGIRAIEMHDSLIAARSELAWRGEARRGEMMQSLVLSIWAAGLDDVRLQRFFPLLAGLRVD